MFAVVGLGNPGIRHLRNRHNAGFMSVDVIARRLSIQMKTYRWHALTGTGTLGEQNIILSKPQTYMNRSGVSVREMVADLQLSLDKLLIIMDDISLPLGALRLRKKGSSGGHNGMEDILAALETDEIQRLRIGIGQAQPPEDLTEFVLSDFDPPELKQMEEILTLSADAMETIVEHGMERSMQIVNSHMKEERNES